MVINALKRLIRPETGSCVALNARFTICNVVAPGAVAGNI